MFIKRTVMRPDGPEDDWKRMETTYFAIIETLQRVKRELKEQS